MSVQYTRRESLLLLLLIDQWLFGNTLVVHPAYPTVLHGFSMQKSNGRRLFGNGEESTKDRMTIGERGMEKIIAPSNGECFFEKDHRGQGIEKEVQSIIEITNG